MVLLRVSFLCLARQISHQIQLIGSVEQLCWNKVKHFFTIPAPITGKGAGVGHHAGLNESFLPVVGSNPYHLLQLCLAVGGPLIKNIDDELNSKRNVSGIVYSNQFHFHLICACHKQSGRAFIWWDIITKLHIFPGNNVQSHFYVSCYGKWHGYQTAIFPVQRFEYCVYLQRVYQQVQEWCRVCNVLWTGRSSVASQCQLFSSYHLLERVHHLWDFVGPIALVYWRPPCPPHLPWPSSPSWIWAMLRCCHTPLQLWLHWWFLSPVLWHNYVCFI